MPNVDTVAELNVLDPTFRPDSPEVAAARTASWYARTPIGFAVLRHAEATALLGDRRLRWGGVDSLAAQGLRPGRPSTGCARSCPTSKAPTTTGCAA